MADAGAINGIFIELHVKLRPTAQLRLRTDTVRRLPHIHSFHTHIDRGSHVTLLARVHSAERREVHQGLFAAPRINHMFYQTLLETYNQKIGSEVGSQETTVCHGIDTYLLSLVIEILGRKRTGAVLLHKRLHQLIITRTQTAIQYLVHRCIRLVKANQHLVHLFTQSMRSILHQSIQILLQVNKKLRYV